MIDLRLRSQISDEELGEKVGKIVTGSDYNLLLTGAARVAKPNGQLLCVYLPGALTDVLAAEPHLYSTLHSMRTFLTDNRGDASGSQRHRHGDEKRTRSKKVPSIMIGAFDKVGGKQFCRMSSWSSRNLERYHTLRPMFLRINDLFAEHAPQRYAAQMERAERTDPAWLIQGTPFTTVTVNNTYPTGVHTDSGDLEEGFSTLAVLRRGEYTGGHLVFPRYRVAVDMQDGDLLLMDAHEHHGNTKITVPILPTLAQAPEGPPSTTPPPERISVVSYFRTAMVDCGTADEEYRAAENYADRGGTR